MEKNKTPLAIAIEELQLIQPKSNHPDYWYGLQTAIDILDNLKPKEREMFEEFAVDYYLNEKLNHITDYFKDNLTQE